MYRACWQAFEPPTHVCHTSSPGSSRWIPEEVRASRNCFLPPFLTTTWNIEHTFWWGLLVYLLGVELTSLFNNWHDRLELTLSMAESLQSTGRFWQTWTMSGVSTCQQETVENQRPHPKNQISILFCIQRIASYRSKTFINTLYFTSAGFAVTILKILLSGTVPSK